MKQILVLVLALAALGCDRGAPASGSPTSQASATATVSEPAPTARRGTRRYFLGRIEARCEVYAVDPDGVSPATSTPCPPDLLPGERIRIAGLTCVREGGDPARVMPVVCPDPLTNLEKRDLASGR